MRRVRVKFCGITREQDAHAAVALGVDAIGLVLTPRSKRRLDLGAARALRAVVPPLVSTVALFMDDEPRWIAEAVSVIHPDLLQFHGSESAVECARYGCRYLKAIGMADAVDPLEAIAAHASAAGFLLDSHAAGEQGGSGRAFDWTRVPAGLNRPLILAGGLTCDNVGSAIRAVRPYAVDVSSGIESSPGIKDAEKMRRFIEEVERACSEIEN
jgi:phosphoribosylanthranilate isomerase